MVSVLPPRAEPAPRSLVAEIEERFLVPTYASRWAPATIAAHRGMAFPLQLVGQVRRWSICRGGGQLQLAGIGREKLVEPILRRLFGELPEPMREARRMLWSPAALAGAGPDLVAAEVHRWMASRFRRAGWVIVPATVRWEGELAQVPPANPQRSLLDDLRKIGKNGFDITHTTAPEDWEEFFTEMVEPQARFRHGPTAWLPSRRLMQEFAAAGTLHLVTKDGRRLAGMCSIRRGETLWLPVSGIRHGDPLLLRQGAGTAALAFTVEWARSAGYRRVDAGRTGPFVHDGLQQFKRKWGLSPVPDALAHLAAVWVGSGAAREAFARQPVLVEDGATLEVYPGEGE